MNDHEERRPPDPTRKLLRTFGVKVTTYEERTAEILERLRGDALDPGERVRLAAEAVALSEDLAEILRETTDHVLSAQGRVLAGMADVLGRSR